MRDKEFLKSIGENVSFLRKAKGISQRELGLRIDMEKTHISSIENGHRNPTALTLKKIAEALECDVCRLVKWE